MPKVTEVDCDHQGRLNPPPEIGTSGRLELQETSFQRLVNKTIDLSADGDVGAPLRCLLTHLFGTEQVLS